MATAPKEQPTTLDDVLAFFDREPVDVEKTNAFSQLSDSELVVQLRARIESAFPDAGVQHSVPLTVKIPGLKAAETAEEAEDATEYADLLIDVPGSDTRIVVDIKQSISPDDVLLQLELNLNRLAEPKGDSVLGALVLAVPLDNDEQAAEIEEQARWWQQQTEHDIHILTPRRAWPVFFEEYEKPTTDRKTDRAKEQKTEPVEETKPPDAARIYMLSDDALRGQAGDRLGFGEYAAAFGGLINDQQTVTPLTLAINAKWGVGKTSLACMIEEHLVKGQRELGERPHVTYWFNAWMHDEATDLGQAFMTDIVRYANSLRPWWRRFLSPLPTALYSERDYRQRRWWIGAALVVLAFFGSVVAVEFVGIDVIKTLEIEIDDERASAPSTKLIGSVALVFAFSLVLVRYLTSAFESISDFLSKLPSPADTGTLSMVREQLKRLLTNVVPEDRKFVVFIDDLERCRPTRSIDVLEVVNQLLSFEPVVTIIVADMAALAANAEIKYAALAYRYNPETGEIGAQAGNSRHSYGRLFLQKFIQLQFDLPEPSEKKIRQLINELANKKRADEDEDRQRASRWARGSFGEIGAIVQRLGPTLFAAWNKSETAAGMWRDLVHDVPRSLRPLALVLWIPLLPFMWAERLGLWLAGERQLRSAKGWSARFGKPAVFFCLVLTGYFGGLFAQQDWAGLFGWALLTGDDVAGLFASLGFAVTPKESPIFATELARLVDYVAEVLFAYLPAVAAGVIVGLFGLYQRIRRVREQRRQSAVFESELEKGAASVPPKRPEDSAIGEHAWQALYLRKRQQYLTHDSELFTKAREYAFKHLLLVPRNAKRLLNRLRLNLFILDQQNAFMDRAKFGPEHLGKWVALHERWPELATAITRDSAFMKRIEKEVPKPAKTASKATRSKLRKLLDEQRVPRRPADDGALFKILTDPPRLAPVIVQLTSFEPEEAKEESVEVGDPAAESAAP